MRWIELVVFTYLITKDLVATLERKFRFKLESQIRKNINTLEDKFLSEFWQFIPSNIEKLALPCSEISATLSYMVEQSTYPVISLDRVYFRNAADYLEVCRITNPLNGQTRIAERPGCASIEEQILRLKRFSCVILADIGAFEGNTLEKTCFEIEQSGIKIVEVYLGVSSIKANRRINNSRRLTALRLFDFYEWIELRDLFGIDGRNVCYQKGSRLFMQYWENLSGWASIPVENEFAVKLLCKEYNLKLLRLLQKQGYDLNVIGVPIEYKPKCSFEYNLSETLFKENRPGWEG